MSQQDTLASAEFPKTGSHGLKYEVDDEDEEKEFGKFQSTKLESYATAESGSDPSNATETEMDCGKRDEKVLGLCSEEHEIGPGTTEGKRYSTTAGNKEVSEDVYEVKDAKEDPVRLETSTTKTTQSESHAAHSGLSSESPSTHSLEEDLKRSDENKAKVGSSVQDHLIGSSGKNIQIGGCEVIIPENAVKKEVNIQFVVGIPPEERSSEYAAITPQLSVKYKPQFLHPVRMRLTTWCLAKDGVNVEAEVIRESEDKCDVIARPLISNDGFIEFECSHFCRVRVRLKREHWESVRCRVSCVVYVNGPQILIGVCFDLDKYRAEIKEKMKGVGAKCIVCPDTIIAEAIKSIMFGLSISEIIEPLGTKFTLTKRSDSETFLSEIKSRIFYCHISPRSSFGLWLNLTVDKEGDEVAKISEYPFYHYWEDEQQRRSQEIGKESRSVATTDLRVAAASHNAIAACGNVIFNMSLIEFFNPFSKKRRLT